MSEFGRQLQRHIPALQRYARTLTRDRTAADDLLQTCLARALAKQHLWRPGSDLRAWLFTMLHHQRSSDLRRATHEERYLAQARSSAAPVAAAAGLIAILDLDRAIATLPEDQRRVVLMVAVEDAGHRDCATVLGAPIGTIRSRLARGRARLRRLLEIEEDARRRPRRAARNREAGLAA